MTSLKKVWPIVWKDLISELRSKEVLISMCFFSFLVLIIFNFAFFTSIGETEGILSGMLWVAFIFAGLFGLNQTFGAEKDRGSLEGLLLCPVNRSTLYLGKVISGLLFMSIMEILILGLFAILFRVNVWGMLIPLAFVVFLGTLGFVFVGTIFSAMSVNAKAREILLAIILFPIVVPLVIASVKATENIFKGEFLPEIYGWLKILIAFDIIFFLVSYWTFDFVVEE
ncbi:MAG: ABC transporter permease subunit [Proteobacteria bacterium]|nr:ABC transporter permease subunit [Pseudomonadota bacterium]